MKKHIFLLLALFSSIISFAQITFERDTTYNGGTTSMGQVMELNVYGTNTTGVQKKFIWIVDQINTPSAWVNALCTFPGSCFNITVGYKDSFTIDADSEVLIRVDFSTLNTCGQGFIKVSVYPSDDVRNKKALYFSGNSFCTSIADQKESDAMVTLYPNPASNLITIESPAQNTTISIYNNLGVKIDEFNSSSTQTNYDISNLSKGNYYLWMKDNSNNHSYVKEFSKF